MIFSARIARFFIASLAVAILGASNAEAATWTGAIDGDLAKNGNWTSPASVPTSSQDADFNSATAPDPTMGDLSPRSIFFFGAAKSYDIGGGTITIPGNVTSSTIQSQTAVPQMFSNTHLIVTLANNAARGVTANGTGTLTIASQRFDFNATGAGTIRAQNGDIRITSPTFNVTGNNGSQTLFTETAARTITVDTPMNVGAGGNTVTANIWFRNFGTIWVNNGFTGAGTKDSAGGHVGLYQSGRTVLGNSGSWGGNIFVEGGTLEINDSTSLGAGGELDGYTQLADGNNTGTGRLNLAGAGINTPETIRLMGRLTGGVHHLANILGSNTFSGNLDIFATGGTGSGDYVHIRSDVSGETLTVAGTVTNNLTVDRIVTFRGDGDTLLSGVNNLVEASTGKLSLQKENLGVMTIAGNQNYTGTTNVLGGTLVVNGAHTGGLYTIGPNGTLAGSGSITADVTVSGTISPGNSPGPPLSVIGDVTLNGTLLAEVEDPLSDLLAITGNLTLGSGSILDLSLGNIYDPWTTYDLITFTGTRTGEFGSLTNPVPVTHTLEYLSNSVSLVPVPIPEPASVMLATLGGVVGLSVFLRRRKHANR